MDLTWPLTNSDASEGPQPAVDFMVNAFKLLHKEESQSSRATSVAPETDVRQGKHDFKNKKSNKTTLGKTPKSNKRTSECSWDGSSEDEDVEFVKRTWSLFQQAMDEGWVTDWVSKYTHSDINIYDSVAKSKAHGHAEVCIHYNRVLEAVWGNGQSTLTWIPHSFNSMGPGTGIVNAEYEIELTPKIDNYHTKQLWVYRVHKERLMELRVYPISHFSPTTFRTTSLTPQLKGDNGQTGQNSSQPVGVALTKPCTHNSWDNVRVKRGWAILRCRICHLQWRLRPTAIPHCDSFARGMGCCPMGVECTQLHVHRTREQTEAKKHNEASRTSGGELVEAGSAGVLNGVSQPATPAALPQNRTYSGASDGLPGQLPPQQHLSHQSQQSYSSHSPYENYPATESIGTYDTYDYDYLDQSTSKQHQPYATPEEVPVRSLQVHQQQFLQQQQYQQVGYQHPPPPSYISVEHPQTQQPEQKTQTHPSGYPSQDQPPPQGGGIPAPQGGGIPAPQGGGIPAPQGGGIPAPQGGGIPAPQGGGIPAPQGGGIPAPQGGGIPAPQGGGIPAPQGGGIPAPQGGGIPAPQGGGIPAPQGGGYDIPSPMVQHSQDPYRSIEQQQLPQRGGQTTSQLPQQDQKSQSHPQIYPSGQEAGQSQNIISNYEQLQSPLVQHNPDPHVSTPNSAPSQPPPMYQTSVHPQLSDGTAPIGYHHDGQSQSQSQSQAPPYIQQQPPMGNHAHPHQMPHPVQRVPIS